MERQLTTTTGTRPDRFERILSSLRPAWNQRVPLYVRYGVPYFLGAGRRMAVEADGARFSVRPRSFDLYILQEVYERRAYAPRCELQTRPRRIVDLGANIGAFSVWAGRKWTPEKLLAVEMEPENFAILQDNLRANLGKEALALQAAVWDREGGVRIRRHRVNMGLHEVLPQAGDLRVPSLTLEALLASAAIEHVDFLKVDIEGAESRLFTPANAGIFSARVGRVAAELHPNKGVDVGGILRYLEGLGFAASVRRQPANRALMLEAVHPLAAETFPAAGGRR